MSTRRDQLAAMLRPHCTEYKPLLAMSDPDVIGTLRLEPIELDELLDMVDEAYRTDQVIDEGGD